MVVLVPRANVGAGVMAAGPVRLRGSQRVVGKAPPEDVRPVLKEMRRRVVPQEVVSSERVEARGMGVGAARHSTP